MTCTPLDKMDTPDRLIEFARCIREFGPDITYWGSPPRVANLLEEHAARIFASRAWAEQDKLRTTWRPIETDLEAENASLRKVLNTLFELHMREQEGLSSGMPSPDDWTEAVDAAWDALKGKGDEG